MEGKRQKKDKGNIEGFLKWLEKAKSVASVEYSQVVSLLSDYKNNKISRSQLLSDLQTTLKPYPSLLKDLGELFENITFETMNFTDVLPPPQVGRGQIDLSQVVPPPPFPIRNEQVSPFNMSRKEPIRVVVTGAAGQIGYSLIPMIASGEMFGKDQRLIIHLLEIPPALRFLDGLMMELNDSVYDLVDKFVPTVDQDEGFKDVDFAILVGAFPRLEGMSRRDLLGRNGPIFKDQGQTIIKNAKKDVKVLVVGNPANTNTLILSHFAEGVKKENITCMTRLDMNRNKAQIALKCGVHSSQVKNVFTWGNHSASQFPTCNHGYVEMDDGRKVPCRQLVDDDEWINTQYRESIKKRGSAVLSKRGKSSATSAAKAACDHMRDWYFGTKPGEFICMGVASTGDYGVPEGIVFSYPVTCKNGTYEIVKGLQLSEEEKKGIQANVRELFHEKEVAFEKLQDTQ